MVIVKALAWALSLGAFPGRCGHLAGGHGTLGRFDPL